VEFSSCAALNAFKALFKKLCGMMLEKVPNVAKSISKWSPTECEESLGRNTRGSDNELRRKQA
jgi:hypothetical protein